LVSNPGVRADRSPVTDDVADAAGRPVNVGCPLTGWDVRGLHEVLQEDFTGVNPFWQFGGHAVLVRQ
jgi:hypothetical protein